MIALSARGKGLALALAGADNGDACGCHSSLEALLSNNICRSDGFGYGFRVSAPDARVTKLVAHQVRGLGVGVWGFHLYIGEVPPKMVVGCRIRLLR